jgi:hypothetical protein
LNKSLGGNPCQSGTITSPNNIQIYNWVNLLDLTQNVPSVLIVQPLMNILFSFGKSWISTTYHGEMFITWTKKAVWKEVDKEYKPLNILSLVITDLNTSYTVQIWNLLQLLSVFVLMQRVSSLVS